VAGRNFLPPVVFTSQDMIPSNVMLLVAGISLLASACQKQRDAAPAVQDQVGTAEHKTVEFIEKGESKIIQHYEEWNTQGWAVVSVSKPFPRPDGTVLRKVELGRPKK
jgi:hypothetical protein